MICPDCGSEMKEFPNFFNCPNCPNYHIRSKEAEDIAKMSKRISEEKLFRINRKETSTVEVDRSETESRKERRRSYMSYWRKRKEEELEENNLYKDERRRDVLLSENDDEDSKEVIS